MKLIVFSDLHIHNYKRFDVNGSRLENTLDVLHEIATKANALGIDTVLFAGDLFDKHKVIPTQVVNRTIETLRDIFEHSSITIYAISGNHDLASNNTFENEAITALTHLDFIFERFVLIDRDSIMLHSDVVIRGIPYFEHAHDFKTYLDTVEPTEILLIHQTPPNSNKAITADIDLSMFKHYGMTFCGHIHAFEQLSPNFVIVGSPLHRDLGDEGLDKGFLIYDTDTQKIERVLLDYPKFSRSTTGVDNNDDYIIDSVPETISKTPKTLLESDDSAIEMITKYVTALGLPQSYAKYGKLLLV